MTAEETMQFMMDFNEDLFPTRKHCLNYLFCEIGNGFEWVNGDLVDPDDPYSKRYILVADIVKAVGRHEEYWWRNYESEKSLREILGKVCGDGEPGFRTRYHFKWCTPDKSHSHLFNYPSDITKSWRKALEECAKYLIEDGVIDSNWNILGDKYG